MHMLQVELPRGVEQAVFQTFAEKINLEGCSGFGNGELRKGYPVGQQVPATGMEQ